MFSKGLGPHTSGNIRDLISISIPVCISSFSSSLMLFCDRYFLSRHSIDYLNAVALAGYLILLFQLPSMRLTSTNQVFVGRSLGEGNVKNIGIYTWQMIWFSPLTQLISLPIGLFISGFYFAHTQVASLGRTYFLIMMMGHFLFPLGAALASFQLGIGKTKVLMLISVGVNVFNGFLDYFLINGFFGNHSAAWSPRSRNSYAYFTTSILSGFILSVYL